MIERFTKPTQALDYLKDVQNTLPQDIQRFTHAVLSTPYFNVAPASRDHHDNIKCGLLIHTANVVKMVTFLAPDISNIHYDVVIVAAFFHDVCKVLEYKLTSADTEEGYIIEHQPYGKLIGHIYGAAELFTGLCHDWGTDKEFREAVLHCILSHHGRKEWGSPIEPATPEAWILHSADMMMSR